MKVLIADLAQRLGVEPTEAAVTAALDPPASIPKQGFAELVGPATAPAQTEDVAAFLRTTREPPTTPGW